MSVLVKGGTVIDPVQGLNGVLDVALRDGKVAEVGSSISANSSEEVFDASGLINTGLF